MARLQIITVQTLQKITSGCNIQSYKTTYYRNLSWQTKAWHDTTKCIEQKSFTDHEPKRIRRYDGTHVNMALMQNAFKRQANTFKTRMQKDKMKLHAILSKFHIDHTQNGATVQHIHSIQV